MRVDELRRALDDAAGPRPEARVAHDVVVGRARARRRRDRFVAGTVAVAAVVSVVVVVLATVPARERVTAGRGRSGAAAGRLTWTTESLPVDAYPRIVHAGAHSFLVGGTLTAALIDVDTKAGWRASYRGPSGGRELRRPSVNDVVSAGGAMVAVGRDVALPSSEVGAAAWMTRDGGRTWTRAAVEQPREAAAAVPAGVTVAPTSMARVVAFGGRLYAFGGLRTFSNVGNGATVVLGRTCRPLVWTSSDGERWSLVPIDASAACGAFVGAVAGRDGLLALTDDGEVWAPRDGRWRQVAQPGDSRWSGRGLAADDHGYVAVGSNVDSSEGLVWWSPDGRVWRRALTTSPPDSVRATEAAVADVTQGRGGFVAVGWAIHPGEGEPDTDARVWTSADGRHWSEIVRTGGLFAPLARADSVASAPGGGFDLVGVANIRGSGALADPVRQDPTLWRGR